MGEAVVELDGVLARGVVHDRNPFEAGLPRACGARNER
jgi:hypothetical protein